MNTATVLTRKTPLLVVASVGNPEPQFSRTRHSIGHELLNVMNINWKSNSPEKTILGSSARYPNVIFMKSPGYMNLSGKYLAPSWRSVHETLNTKYSEIRYMCIHDELSKQVGKYQLRYGKVSSRGHNGLKSLVEHYGNDFYRFGVGIGKPIEKSDVTKHVLGKFNGMEWETTLWDVLPELEKTIEILRSVETVEFRKDKLVGL